MNCGFLGFFAERLPNKPEHNLLAAACQRRLYASEPRLVLKANRVALTGPEARPSLWLIE